MIVLPKFRDPLFGGAVGPQFERLRQSQWRDIPDDYPAEGVRPVRADPPAHERAPVMTNEHGNLVADRNLEVAFGFDDQCAAGRVDVEQRRVAELFDDAHGAIER